MDYSKAKNELGWEPAVNFEDGLKKTIDWYKNNKAWWHNIKSGEYLEYYKKNYSGR
jgi:dTDP-glucose 4,6-dehydratase